MRVEWLFEQQNGKPLERAELFYDRSHIVSKRIDGLGNGHNFVGINPAHVI
jgi:hypothetical protein